MDSRFKLTVVDRIYQGALVRYRLTTGWQEIVCEMQNQTQSERFAKRNRDRGRMGPDKGHPRRRRHQLNQLKG